MSPNDICSVCGEAVIVPERAIRCEHGGCIFGYSVIGEGEDQQIFLSCTHQCRVCLAETHRYSPAQLIARALDGTPVIPPRADRDRMVAEANAKSSN